MNLTIEIPDKVAAALEAKAEAEGLSVSHCASRMIEKNLAHAIEPEGSGRPFETGYGMWAKYGEAPSAEEIDENRRQMVNTFPRDF